MARSKVLSSDELIKQVDEFRFENPGTCVSIPALGEYIRKKGFPIQDYTLRRDADLRKYIESIVKKEDGNTYVEVVTYRTLDVDTFLENNRTQAELKAALSQRDQYYARIAATAVEAIKKKKATEKSLQELQEKCAALESALAHKAQKEDTAAMKEKDAVITKLKGILDTYVYPDVANTLLEKEGILETVNHIVNLQSVESLTLKANAPISAPGSRYDSVNRLLGDFDE